MAKTSTNLSAADEALAVRLAGGEAVASAAAGCAMSERTVYRRLELPAFSSRVEQLRRDLVARACRRLSASMAAAADVLVELMSNSNPQIRHQAARDLLKLALVADERLSVLDRLDAIEKAMSEGKKGRSF